MSVLDVACAVDRNYVPHSAAMLHSVLAHRGDLDVRVHYLFGADVPAESTRRLGEMIERNGATIALHQISGERVEGLTPNWEYITAPSWYRMFLPELLPDVDRILYLDVDTIVVDSLEPLWETDLTDYYVAAVTNVFQADHLHRPEAIGLSNPAAYFNAGVLLMNLDLMRSDACSGKLREVALARGEELWWLDQDVLNIVLGGRRRPLHPRWNCMNSILNFPWSAYVFGSEAVSEARRNPAIRHFEGPSANKPWHFLCSRDMRRPYVEHRRQTPWPDYRLEGVTPRNVIKRLLGAIRYRVSIL